MKNRQILMKFGTQQHNWNSVTAIFKIQDGGCVLFISCFWP